MTAKIFDAMAVAKPIISTNVSDVPEILDTCGWIVEPENPRKLAKMIQYVFDNPIEAKEKGKKTREKCKRKYNWGIIEGELTSIFEKYKSKKISASTTQLTLGQHLFFLIENY